MKLRRIGWGAGQKDFPLPNLLRLFVGEPCGDAVALPSDTVVLLETNLDDMSPELYARAMEQAFAAGAVDVWATPIQMKKQRPAFTMSALVAPEQADAVALAMLRETTAFGVRRQLMQRQCLDREHVTVSTAYGDLRVKVGKWAGEVLTVAPEYGDCLAAAEGHGAAVKLVYQAALSAYHHSHSAP
jgi:pyridinium-3,5-bisthiocarboxylic acid mononucleotide nickel chelatase